ncbi:hypothetical protein COOONC_08784 [Cooperia oncophora]
MFILMISYTLSISALVKIPALNEWSGCKMETCLRNMYRTRNFFTVTVYAFTLVVFFSTVLLIRRAQKFVDSFKRENPQSLRGRRVRFPLWKLALNVGTFAVLYLFYAIWCAGLLINQDQCFFQRNYPEMMRILAIVRCTLMLRIIVDPILSFATDLQVKPLDINVFSKMRFLGASEIKTDAAISVAPPTCEALLTATKALLEDKSPLREGPCSLCLVWGPLLLKDAQKGRRELVGSASS